MKIYNYQILHRFTFPGWNKIQSARRGQFRYCRKKEEIFVNSANSVINSVINSNYKFFITSSKMMHFPSTLQIQGSIQSVEIYPGFNSTSRNISRFKFNQQKYIQVLIQPVEIYPGFNSTSRNISRFKFNQENYIQVFIQPGEIYSGFY